jgi:cell division septation protein DedD
MSRKSARRDGDNGFLRKLAWTVLLALVFSAGLITGQRMIRSETRAPLVSVSAKKEAPGADSESSGEEADESTDKKEPLFSFYDRLSEGVDSREPESGEKQAPSEAADESANESASEADQQADDEDEAPSGDSDDRKADDSSEQTPGAESSGASDSEQAAAKYTLQVSAYSSMDRARARIGKLADKGLDAHVVSAEVPDKGTYYRVRIGKFATMEKAEKFQAEIERKRGVDTFVTPL